MSVTISTLGTTLLGFSVSNPVRDAEAYDSAHCADPDAPAGHIRCLRSRLLAI